MQPSVRRVLFPRVPRRPRRLASQQFAANSRLPRPVEWALRKGVAALVCRFHVLAACARDQIPETRMFLDHQRTMLPSCSLPLLGPRRKESLASKNGKAVPLNSFEQHGRDLGGVGVGVGSGGRTASE